MLRGSRRQRLDEESDYGRTFHLERFPDATISLDDMPGLESRQESLFSLKTPERAPRAPYSIAR